MRQVLALCGNPNSGKSTLFNALTGARQSVGNWPGVTVEKRVGKLRLEGTEVDLVDLPGIYSFGHSGDGMDEKIAHEFLEFGELDLVINIVSARHLERGLVLTQQLIDSAVPVVVALNMIDVAGQRGLAVDSVQLERLLGVPVVPIVAARGQGLDELLRVCAKHLPALPQRMRVTSGMYDSAGTKGVLERLTLAGQLAQQVITRADERGDLTDRIDRWVLHPVFGIPLFLAMMYLLFTLAVNLGAVFIDFFDIVCGELLVQTTRWLLALAGTPEWLTVLLAEGVGGGIQLVASFIPVLACMYLWLALLEDSGYMARAAFVVDRLMARMELPGTAFVPLIVGFGCNVPAIMATRSLNREKDRLVTIAMAPFMSCSARLTVFALFAAVFYPESGQHVIFSLYLLGILMGVATGYVFRRRLFRTDPAPGIQEMPDYHVPVLQNVLLSTWFRLTAFLRRAGRTIVAVFVVLSFLNAVAADGTLRVNEGEESILAAAGRAITPLFAPMGITADNWQATVGLLAGLLAKEAVIGSLDALYSRDARAEMSAHAPDPVGAIREGMERVGENFLNLLRHPADPIGLRALQNRKGELTGVELGAGSVHPATARDLAASFGGAWPAFCYLVFVLLYVPCSAVMGVIARESSPLFMTLVTGWSLSLAYVVAGFCFQVSRLPEDPVGALAWIGLFGCILAGMVYLVGRSARLVLPANLIPVVQQPG